MFLNSSFGKLDTKLVMLFVTKFSEYYLGTKVILNTGETAMILKFNEYELTKPLIRTDSGIFIDTSINREVKMVDFQLIWHFWRFIVYYWIRKYEVIIYEKNFIYN